jgi:L-ascorbate metabolism protein UlaG (beta-lactamase superfamily)
MPYENWKTSVHSKVTGTKNLHEVLSHFPLDFFVITSSVSGVLGTPGQSNYAAGDTYLDVFARHRHSHRQKAVSIVLPWS